jgi:hypothetical protein
MKKNQIALLIVLLLGGITVWLMNKNETTTVPKELRDFAVSDTATITKIFLADKANHQVLLEKQIAGGWMVNKKWKARKDGIINLLFVIKNLSIKSMVGIQAQEHIIKNLASGATKIEIYKGDKLIKMYYVGGATPDDEGTYMLLANAETKQNSTRPFVMCIEGQTRYLSTVYQTNEGEWRDKTVFSYIPPAIKSVKVEFTGSSRHSFEVLQPRLNTFEVHAIPNNSNFPHIDTLAVKQYLSYFQNVGFETFLTDMNIFRRDSILNSPPLCVLTIRDQADQTTELKFFGMEPHREELDANQKPEKFDLDRMYTLINKSQFVVTQYYVFGKLLTDIEYFANKGAGVKK